MQKYLLFLAFLPLHAFSQQSPTAEDVKIAEEYRDKFKKASVVLFDATTIVEFKMDKSTKTPRAIETESFEFLSLRNAYRVSTAKMYDDQSRILKASLVNSRNRDIPLIPVCGNYDIEDIFYSDAQICRYSIELKNLGERKTLTTEKEFQDLRYFTSAYFQESFPIRQRILQFVVPDWLKVEFKEINFGKFKVLKTVKPDPKQKTTIYQYALQDVDAIKEESYSAGHSRTYPHLLVLFKSFEFDGKTTPIISSTDDLYGWYHSLAQGESDDMKSLEPIVKQLIANKSTDEEKLKAIYYWVQDNIRYIAYENGIAGFKPEKASLVCQKKYGDCKGMANLTKAMLKIAGYDARLTWIGTSKIAYDYSTPSLAVDNHMICCVLLGGKKYFLDATEKFCPLNDYGERIQGRQVLIENGNQYLLERIPTANKERNHILIEQQLRIENGAVAATGKTTLNGEMKTGLLYMISQTEKSRQNEGIRKMVSLDKKDFTVSKLEHTSLKEREKPFVVSYDYTAVNTVSVFDKDVYVMVDHEQDYKDFTIQDERISDIDFTEKVLHTSKIKLKIPTGYKLSHLPKSLHEVHEDYSFHINYTEKEGEIWYEKQIAIEKGIIQQKDFAAWNKSIKALKQCYNDKVIFTKTTD